MTTTYHGSHSPIRPTATGTGGCRPAAFSGFHSPRYTMVPDALFDELMAYLSGAELKVLLYIIRRTFGFKKECDSISLNQICHGITTREGQVLDQGTGLSQSTVQLALKGLVEKQAIVARRRSSPDRGYEATAYRLNLTDVLLPSDEAESPPPPIFSEGGLTENRHSPSPKIGETRNRETTDRRTTNRRGCRFEEPPRTVQASGPEHQAASQQSPGSKGWASSGGRWPPAGR